MAEVASKELWAAAVKAGDSADPRAVRMIRLYPRLRDQFYISPCLFRDWQAVDEPLRVVLENLAWGESPWPLYLYGPVGSGKTRAMLAWCDRLEVARYWTVDDLMHLADSRTDRDPPWIDPVHGSWRRNGWPSLAVLDEVAIREKVSDWEYSAVKRFADWREDRPTVYISNHSPDVIGRKYDERVESRLTCGTVHKLTGPDRRKQ